MKFGTTQLAVDFDVVDAKAVIGNATKTYSSYAINYVGAGMPQAQATGINYQGVVVGYADVPTGAQPGCPLSGWCGFIYNQGAYTWVQAVDQGQSQYTYFNGINDLGIVVGRYGTSGFSYDSSTAIFTPVNYPGAVATDPTAINDAGQIVGSWTDNTTTHGFTYINGKFASYDYPLAIATYFTAINGDSQIIGQYLTSDSSPLFGFIYNVATGVSTPIPNYPNSSNTVALGINNNGQIVGYAQTTSNSVVYFIYDQNILTFSNLPPSVVPPSVPSGPAAINDQGLLLGINFAATPQN